MLCFGASSLLCLSLRDSTEVLNLLQSFPEGSVHQDPLAWPARTLS